MKVQEIKNASSKELMQEIVKRPKTAKDYQMNKVYADIAETKRVIERKLYSAATTGNYNLFAQIKQDEKEEYQ